MLHFGRGTAFDAVVPADSTRLGLRESSKARSCGLFCEVEFALNVDVCAVSGGGPIGVAGLEKESWPAADKGGERITKGLNFAFSRRRWGRGCGLQRMLVIHYSDITSHGCARCKDKNQQC
jgi:hypothetical protein